MFKNVNCHIYNEFDSIGKIVIFKQISQPCVNNAYNFGLDTDS